MKINRKLADFISFGKLKEQIMSFAQHGINQLAN